MTDLGVARLRTEIDNTKLKQGLKQSENQIKGWSSSMTAAIGAVSFAVITRGIKEMVTEGAKLSAVEAAFKGLAGSMSGPLLKAFRDASAGAISLSDSYGNLNLTLQLFRSQNLDPSVAQIKELVEVSKGASLALGIDLTKAYDDLALGIARQSRKILDNVGIIVRSEEAQRKYAIALGKTATQLTATEKNQAFLTEALAKGAELRELGKLFDDSDVAALSRIGAFFKDIKGTTGQAFTDLFRPLLSSLDAADVKLTKLIGQLNAAGIIGLVAGAASFGARRLSGGDSLLGTYIGLRNNKAELERIKGYRSQIKHRISPITYGFGAKRQDAVKVYTGIEATAFENIPDKYWDKTSLAKTGEKINNLNKALEVQKSKLEASSKAWKAFGSQIGSALAFGAVIAAVTFGIQKLQEEANKFKEVFKETNDIILSFQRAMGSGWNEALANIRDTGENTSVVNAKLEEFRDSLKELNDSEAITVFNTLVSDTNEFNSELITAETNLGKLDTAIARTNKKLLENRLLLMEENLVPNTFLGHASRFGRTLGVGGTELAVGAWNILEGSAKSRLGLPSDLMFSSQGDPTFKGDIKRLVEVQAELDKRINPLENAKIKRYAQEMAKTSLFTENELFAQFREQRIKSTGLTPERQGDLLFEREQILKRRKAIDPGYASRYLQYQATKEKISEIEAVDYLNLFDNVATSNDEDPPITDQQSLQARLQKLIIAKNRGFLDTSSFKNSVTSAFNEFEVSQAALGDKGVSLDRGASLLTSLNSLGSTFSLNKNGVAEFTALSGAGTLGALSDLAYNPVRDWMNEAFDFPTIPTEDEQIGASRLEKLKTSLELLSEAFDRVTDKFKAFGDLQAEFAEFKKLSPLEEAVTNKLQQDIFNSLVPDPTLTGDKKKAKQALLDITRGRLGDINSIIGRTEKFNPAFLYDKIQEFIPGFNSVVDFRQAGQTAKDSLLSGARAKRTELEGILGREGMDPDEAKKLLEKIANRREGRSDLLSGLAGLIPRQGVASEVLSPFGGAQGLGIAAGRAMGFSVGANSVLGGPWGPLVGAAAEFILNKLFEKEADLPNVKPIDVRVVEIVDRRFDIFNISRSRFFSDRSNLRGGTMSGAFI